MEGLTETTEYVGLEAGKTYRVEVAAYKTTADGLGMYLSEKAVSSEVQMKKPTPAAVTVSAQGAKALADELAGLADSEGNPLESSIDVVNQTQVVINITSDAPVSGTWTLDGGMAEGSWSANPSAGDLLLHGHTHIYKAQKEGDVYVANPGSITLPKDGLPRKHTFWKSTAMLVSPLSESLASVSRRSCGSPRRPSTVRS